MKDYNMCILIVTYKRNEAIRDYLEQKARYYIDNHIDVVIYDSSPDNETEQVAKEYIKRYGDSVKYVKYKDPSGDDYGAKKTKDALWNCSKEYDYVWLCGDTTILQIQDYADELENALKNKSDVIHIYESSDIKTQEITDRNFFLKKFFWSMTHWCSFILSKDIIKDMDKYMGEYIERGYVNLVVFAIYAALTDEKYKIHYINAKPYKYSIYRKSATAYAKKDVIRGYAKMISVGVRELPEEYNDVKKETMKSFSKETGLFSAKGVVELRAYENITFGEVTKYRRCIKDVTDVPVLWFYICCLMPVKFATNFSYSKREGSILEKLNDNAKKIIIYGAGKYGCELYQKLMLFYPKIDIISVADKKWNEIKSEHNIISPTDINRFDYDYVVIGIVDKKIRKSVKKELINLGISNKKIIVF